MRRTFGDATWRTRSRSLDTPDPALSPARGSLAAFPLAGRLPSTASSPGRPGSFGSLTGTTRPSDFPWSCIKGLPPKRSPHGPPPTGLPPREPKGTGYHHRHGRPRDLPVLSMKSFVHAQALRPRGVPQQLAIALLTTWPSANDEDVGTPEFRSITRLNRLSLYDPYRRFAATLTSSRRTARGRQSDRYSIVVENSHLLLHAGCPALSVIPEHWPTRVLVRLRPS